MRQTGRETQRGAGVLRAGVAAILAGAATCAVGQQLSLQTQLQYRWVETTGADGARVSYGRFTPLYLLNVRGPLFGGTNIQANVGMSGMSSTDPYASVDQHNMRLDLTATGGHLDVFASLSRDTNRASYAGFGGQRTTLTATTNNLSVTGTLSYPRYPSLTFQYARSESSLGGGEPLIATTWLVAGNYTRGPWRLTADRSTQRLGEADGSGHRSQYGVMFRRAVLPNVDLSVDHLRSDALFETGGQRARTRGTTTTARVTAYPTPAVVVEGEFGLTRSSRSGGVDSAAGDTEGRRYSLDLRTEVVPGTQFDVFLRSQRFDSLFGASSNSDFAVDIDSRLGPDTTLGAQWSWSRSEFGASHFQTQDQLRLTLSGQLSTDTSLYASTSRARRDNELGGSRTLSAEVGVSHQLGPALEVSTYYDYVRRRDDQRGAETTETVHSIAADARWAPNQQWDLRAGLGVTSRENAHRGLSVNPYGEVRWSPTYATTVSVRQYASFSSERLREPDEPPLETSRSSAGFSARLSHQFSERESVEISYEADGGLGSTLDSRKMLQVDYVRSF
ncbi:MAG: hypothetical protein FJX74_16455 [Armatimonadetes bacterium]|nr:hypothetical protein [Armatimonadota bacterium]